MEEEEGAKAGRLLGKFVPQFRMEQKQLALRMCRAIRGGIECNSNSGKRGCCGSRIRSTPSSIAYRDAS